MIVENGIVQHAGSSVTAVMSQAATTAEIDKVHGMLGTMYCGSGRTTTAGAWKYENVLTGIRMKAGETYNFTVNIPGGAADKGYLYLYASDGSTLAGPTTIAAGSTQKAFTKIPDADIEGAYLSVGFAVGGVSVEAEWCGPEVSVIEKLTGAVAAIAAPVSFEQGSLASADGAEHVSNTRIRTGYILADKFKSVSIGRDYNILIMQYNANLECISSSGWLGAGVGATNTIRESECAFVRFLVCTASNANITPGTDTGFIFESFDDYFMQTADTLMKVDVVFESGTLDGTKATESANTKRIRTGFLPASFISVEVGSLYYINMFQYAADYEFLGSTGFVAGVNPSAILENCAHIRFAIRLRTDKEMSATDETGFALYREGIVGDLDRKAEKSKRHFYGHKFNGEVMNTAYSDIGLAPINTAEHFQLAAHLGFNALKGDVRITSDKKLIMCHDAGLTLDANGRVTKYSSENSKVILDTTYDELMSLEYAYDGMGHYAKVCDFDTFVRICKENGKIAYITLRNEEVASLVAGVMETLRKYRMEDHCVVNSYTLATLKEVRKYSDTIPLSQVINLGDVLTKTVVDNVIPLGNSIVTMFLYPTNNPLELWEQSAEALEYAAENDVQIHMAQVSSYAAYSAMVQRGVQGFHITKPFLEYRRSDVQFTVTMSAGVVTFGNIIGSNRLTARVSNNGGKVTISNIAANGSGYGYDDGLPVLWLNTLPFAASVRCANNPNCSVDYQDGALVLETNNVDGVYYVNVNI